ncbi:MAG: hypothetical protein IKW96_10735 [Ruminococcus sp.]|uniref:hypothetical protein n=1 Tax=Ruminococcus sp. TaxID=41978 RepID=UPI0025E1EA4F|nr:hypothetical protein [Ruminococcus sp.]MBR5683725.1 hypothetical protein [Ruminococcus sp.]
MISRVTADFESPELAHMAVKRLRESVEYVYSAKMMYHRIGKNQARTSRSSAFSLIPAYYNSHSNYLTDVISSPVSEDISVSRRRNRTTTACIVCGSAAVDNVISVLNAMGGSNIRFAQ